MANSLYIVAMPKLAETTDGAVVVFEDLVLFVDRRVFVFSNLMMRCLCVCRLLDWSNAAV
jgi:hypothetical protein